MKQTFVADAIRTPLGCKHHLEAIVRALERADGVEAHELHAPSPGPLNEALCTSPYAVNR